MCASAEYFYDEAECRLSQDTRRSQPAAFRCVLLSAVPRAAAISNTRQGRHGERGLPGEPVRAGAVAGVLRVRAPRGHRPRLRGHPAVGQECGGGGDIIYIYLSTYIQTGSLFEMLFYVLC